jgi:hypothetical protein
MVREVYQEVVHKILANGKEKEKLCRHFEEMFDFKNIRDIHIYPDGDGNCLAIDITTLQGGITLEEFEKEVGLWQDA